MSNKNLNEFIDKTLQDFDNTVKRVVTNEIELNEQETEDMWKLINELKSLNDKLSNVIVAADAQIENIKKKNGGGHNSESQDKC